jgi:hypothetical protein
VITVGILVAATIARQVYPAAAFPLDWHRIGGITEINLTFDNTIRLSNILNARFDCLVVARHIVVVFGIAAAALAKRSVGLLEIDALTRDTSFAAFGAAAPW